MTYYDVAVWIDCPLEVAIQQGKARDRINSADERHINRWDDEWAPKDRKYFDTLHPERLATFHFKNKMPKK